MQKGHITLMKRFTGCIAIIVLLNLSLTTGFAAADDLAEARETITRTKPEDQAIHTATRPEDERGIWSRYKWWIVGGLVLAAGGSAAALSGGSSGSSGESGGSGDGGGEVEAAW